MYDYFYHQQKLFSHIPKHANYYLSAISANIHMQKDKYRLYRFMEYVWKKYKKLYSGVLYKHPSIGDDEKITFGSLVINPNLTYPELLEERSVSVINEKVDVINTRTDEKNNFTTINQKLGDVKLSNLLIIS